MKQQEDFHEAAGRVIRAFLAGRDPVPREAPMSSCSVIFVKSFLLLRERNHRIARTDDRPSTSSRLRHRHRMLPRDNKVGRSATHGWPVVYRPALDGKRAHGSALRPRSRSPGANKGIISLGSNFHRWPSCEPGSRKIRSCNEGRRACCHTVSVISCGRHNPLIALRRLKCPNVLNSDAVHASRGKA
jgi:hypothetical protein